VSWSYREEAACPACYGVLRYSQRPTLSRMDETFVLTLGLFAPAWFRLVVCWSFEPPPLPAPGVAPWR
jgi:hypothetical protein